MAAVRYSVGEMRNVNVGTDFLLSAGAGVGGLLAMEGLFPYPGGQGRIPGGWPARVLLRLVPLLFSVLGSWQQPPPREPPEQALGCTGSCLSTARGPMTHADTQSL